MPAGTEEDPTGKRPREEGEGEGDVQAGSKVAKPTCGYSIITGAYANKGLKATLEDVEKEVRNESY
jgi:hypothetical protein